MRAHVAVALVLAACSSPTPPHGGPDAGSGGSGGSADAPIAGDLLSRLRALPGVTAEVDVSQTPGYDYYLLHFTQPVDHDDAASATFQQQVSLIVAAPAPDLAAPMIVETDGYWDYQTSNAVELTLALSANQISIEHRFFATSRPDPADWTKDTIAQMAADEHAITTALKTIFTGAYVATGASKGGMTSTYYRRFYPDDVVATVPYVAPISFGAPDTRYDAFFTDIGPADGACRNAVRAAATEMLQNRRAALLSRAQTQATQDGYAYTRVAIGPALESAVQGLEWSFWQYNGVAACNGVPPVTATDDQMFEFLDQVSPVSGGDDDWVGAFDAYDFQASFQLGYPDTPTPYLTPYLQFGAADYANTLPPGSTAAAVYDGGTAMHDVDSFVETTGSQLLFIYGQWDPWYGGAYTLGAATDSQLAVAPEGTHGSELVDLSGADQAAALAALERWTGVTPSLPDVRAKRMAPPRIPHVVLRAHAKR